MPILGYNSIHNFGAWRSPASALAWGVRGPGFESRRPDQRTLTLNNQAGKRFMFNSRGWRGRTGGRLPMKLSKAVEGFVFALLADGYSTNTVEVYKWALVRLGRYLKNPQVDAIELADLMGPLQSFPAPPFDLI